MAARTVFTVDDFQLFDRYAASQNYRAVPDIDKERFSELRGRMERVLSEATTDVSAVSGWKRHVSFLNPMGRTPKDYWVAVYPPGADHKSFSIQIAAIISMRGVEMCCCLGAGKSEIKDPDARIRNERYFEQLKRRLANLPDSTIAALSAKWGSEWALRRRWREQPGVSDFDNLRDWLDYAAGSQGDGASISRYLTRLEAVDPVFDVSAAYASALQLFAPFVAALDSGQPIAQAPPLTPERGKRSWVIAPGEGARLWDDFERHEIVAIGWDSIGDLTRYTSKDQIAEALRAERTDDTEPTNDALACYQFAFDMHAGDRVYAKRGVGEIIAAGIIQSVYRYDPNRTEYKHVRSVKWDLRGPWTLPEPLQLPQKTLTDISRYRALLEFLESLSEGELPPPPPPPPVPYTIDDATAESFVGREALREMLRLLSRKKNLILQGPPGVGKSFLAKRLAYALIGRRERTQVLEIQFHQSYSYEDFIEGYRPTATGTLEPQDGIFAVLCDAAHKRPGDQFVLIVDEINRGNLSKILGEALTLLESDKRGLGHQVVLPYSKRHFWVPPNVFMIGMMNTADRSLALVDYALRRRFAFFSLAPAFGAPAFRAFLASKGVPQELIDVITTRMEALNKTIRDDAKNFGIGYEIGHSFFCPQGGEEELDGTWYRSIITAEVLPLLREYWFENDKRFDSARQSLLS